EKKELEEELQEANVNQAQMEKMRDKLKMLEKQGRHLETDIDNISAVYDYIIKIEEIQTEAMSPAVYSREIADLPKNSRAYNNLVKTVDLVRKWCDDMDKILFEGVDVIESSS